jgi:hypothetical protein
VNNEVLGFLFYIFLEVVFQQVKIDIFCHFGIKFGWSREWFRRNGWFRKMGSEQSHTRWDGKTTFVITNVIDTWAGAVAN